jgi:hypothetical protein
MHHRIHEAVLGWPGVSSEPGRFGSTRYLVGRRELGHVHGIHHLDLPLPRRLRDALIAEGRVTRHRFVPDSGWATRELRDEHDVDDAIDLLRQQYDRALAGRLPEAIDGDG